MDKVYIFQWIVSGYHIRGYGLSHDSTHNVCVTIASYKPSIYIEVFDITEMKEIKQLVIKLGGIVTDTPNACNIYSCANKGCFFGVTYSSFTVLKTLQSEATGRFKIHESNISKTLQFVSCAQLPTAGWIQVSKKCIKPVDKHVTTCDVEYLVFDWQKQIQSVTEELLPATPTIAYFDLEVNSELVNTFPQDRDDDVIFQIGVVICKGAQTIDSLLLSLTGNDYVKTDDYRIQQYESECDLIQAFIDHITANKINVLCGYNVMGFDIPYLIKRCTRLSILGMFRRMGSDPTKISIEKTVNWMSSAYRCQKYTYILWEGLLTLDLLPIIAHDHKMDSYKLENVAQHFIKCGKDPIKPKDIFNAYRTKNMALVGKYCMQDVYLCRDLLNHLNVWIALCEMAKVCNTDIMPLFTNGQQIKVFSQIYRECTPCKMSDKMYVIPSHLEPSAEEEFSYTGAFVYEPTPGIYNNVIPMDFSSLYPSIIISKNICYSTYVDTGSIEDVPDNVEVYKWQEHNGCEHDTVYLEYDKLRNVLGQLQTKQAALNLNKKLHKEQLAKLVKQIKEVKTQLKETKPTSMKNKCSNFSFGFYNADARPGILPKVLSCLLSSRAKIRAQMKLLDPNDPMKSVLDKRQLAYKISANSVYGSMGTTRGYLPFMQGAMTTTFCGRKMIERAAELLKTVANARLIYGDTDSCYVNLGHPKSSFEELWNLATQASKTVSSFFGDPVKLEFEQTIYVKFIIFSKKRYIYRQKHISGKESIGSKGVLLSRRDNAMCARTVYKQLMDHVLTSNDQSDTCTLMSDCIIDIMRHGVLSDNMFVITRSIGDIGQDDDTGTYKVRNVAKAKLAAGENNTSALRQELVKQLPAQAQLAERLRLQGRAVDKGSRVEYVVLQSPRGVLEESLAQRIIDLETWKDNKDIYPLDRLYYVKSMINACDQIFSVIGSTHVTHMLYMVHKQFCQVMSELRRKRPLI
ncbi:ORF_070R [Scale drop disease virus]|uniref:DNA polymerase n=1 Tax=Scale drop disease virus TaxID=1697349 RepID=A0A0K1L773_9VIRU|nr:ORF_070R [Scale drop disease virus]AKU37485.1 ORF_070R [Scale drop disease virus]UNH60710.1 DNA polymerase [Scale drop disease virus]